MTSARENFAKKAPRLMDRLLDAFGEWDEFDAAACAGNGGHESNGFTAFQETAPTVKNSRGGFGWFQWTGPRRRKFEAWCKTSGLDPKSDEANIQYIIVELKGDEKAAVRATAKATGLDSKVEAFEKNFERAGVKHYPSRKKWAAQALASWQGRKEPAIPVVPAKAIPPVPITDPATITTVQTVLTALKYNPGGVDGKIGPLTRGAILIFRNDHGLPALDYIDKAFLEELKVAKPREMVPERVNATGAQIATMLPEANAHWWNKYIGGGAGGAAAVGAAVNAIPTTNGYLAEIKDVFGDIPQSVWIAFGAVLFLAVAYLAWHGQKKVDEAYRNGDRR